MGKSWNNSSKRIFFLYCYGKAQQYWVMRSHDGPQNNLCLHAILGSRYYVMLPKKKREIFKACKGIFLYGSLKKVIEISAISQSTKNRYFLVLWLAQLVILIRSHCIQFWNLCRTPPLAAAASSSTRRRAHSSTRVFWCRALPESSMSSNTGQPRNRRRNHTSSSRERSCAVARK